MGKGRLSSRELTGLLFLTVICGGIIACSILLGRCDRASSESAAEGPRLEMAPDTLASQPEEKPDKPSKKKKGGKSRSGKKKIKAALPSRDPFSDTIPTDF